MAHHTFPTIGQLPRRAAFPDLLEMPDGQRIRTPGQWEERRAELKAMLEHYFYGKWPAHDKKWTVEAQVCSLSFNGAAIHETLRLISGGCSIGLDIMRPNRLGKCPVITFNNLLDWRCPIEEDVIRRGYAIAMFNRHDIVHDATLEAVPVGKVYPRLNCATVMAWGWGHSIVADYLVTRDFCGPLAATGHSRGGKAALCAGIFDERFEVVAPINSGCGGTGAMRFLGTADGSRQDPVQCETVGALTHAFPDWFAEAFAQFGSNTPPYPLENEEKLPFDAHTLRALIAPRWVLCCEGIEDKWANLYGTQLAWQAAQDVFDLLGAPEGNAFFVRPGPHAFNADDWTALLDFCDARFYQKPIRREAFYAPYFDA